MTFLEKLAIEHPREAKYYRDKCPSDFGYITKEEALHICDDVEDCDDCWGVKKKKVNTGTCKYHEPFNAICCNGDCKPCVADAVDPETTCKVCNFFEEGVFECTE